MKQYNVEFKKGDKVYGIHVTTGTSTIKLATGIVNKIMINKELIYQIEITHGYYLNVTDDNIFGNKEELFNRLNNIIK